MDKNYSERLRLAYKMMHIVVNNRGKQTKLTFWD